MRNGHNEDIVTINFVLIVKNVVIVTVASLLSFNQDSFKLIDNKPKITYQAINGSYSVDRSDYSLLLE